MTPMTTSKPLAGRVAVVAGATRGAGRAIAVELARTGAFVYATGRSSRATGPSEIGRPETIEETEALIKEAGGEGRSLRVDHLEPQQVGELFELVGREQGRLDILVNDIFGGDRYMQWDKPLWEHDLEGGLRMLRMGVDTHLITITKAMNLLLEGESGIVIEVTDGTAKFNENFRKNVGFYYDLVKGSIDRVVKGLNAELGDLPVVALGVTPGWLRSEKMLDDFGVREDNWQEACRATPGFAISESPTYIGRGVAALAGDAGIRRFAGQILTARQLAETYGFTDTDGSRPDCWGFLDKYGIDYEGSAGIEDFR
jgi:NAD(P)-dependent dehydrogenase (short-subunit alcohol dehydrogenase family)